MESFQEGKGEEKAYPKAQRITVISFVRLLNMATETGPFRPKPNQPSLESTLFKFYQKQKNMANQTNPSVLRSHFPDDVISRASNVARCRPPPGSHTSGRWRVGGGGGVCARSDGK